MTAVLRPVARSGDLDEGWDALAATPFQRRAFLGHLETVNPCGQRYWEWHEDGRIRAGAVAYDLRLDLLTFLGLPSPVRMTILGLPVSVGSPGVLGDPDGIRDLVAACLPRERGLVVGLNLDREFPVSGGTWGRTLPSVEMEVPWRSFSEYRQALRSDYRRRLGRVLSRWKGVSTERLPCGAYTGPMHHLYQEVWRRSEGRLERLEPAFFTGLPRECHLSVHRDGEALVAWHVAWTEGPRRWFLFGGVDYRTLGTRATYFNLLVAILREAIDDGVRWLDLGQTAEVPKMRLGGRCRDRRMFGWHRSAAVRWLVRRGRPWLEYRRVVPPAHPFVHGGAA
ncbi:MAG TPA: GNAT family N-acetyltransferase [Myxococcota bacterium]|nr:GNAT family N-acetyltransferase [Myxococcota bacterium]HQK52506.1 GNAT family N-acetyltransferase [Myxococcota bacterium]